jgi:ATP synthase protein I
MSDDQAKRSDLQDLGEKIAKARGEEEAKRKPARRSGADVGDGLRVAIEFVVSVLVGSGLGYTIGSFLGSPVIGLLIGLPIGFAAGLRTVYRSMTATPPEADGGDDE